MSIQAKFIGGAVIAEHGRVGRGYQIWQQEFPHVKIPKGDAVTTIHFHLDLTQYPLWLSV